MAFLIASAALSSSTVVGAVALGAGLGALGTLAFIEAGAGFDLSSGFNALRTKEGVNRVIFGALGGALGGGIAELLGKAAGTFLNGKTLEFTKQFLSGSFVSAGTSAGVGGVGSDGKFNFDNIRGGDIGIAFLLEGTLTVSGTALEVAGANKIFRAIIIVNKEGAFLLIPYFDEDNIKGRQK